ncbi:MAG: TrkA family potassium uptake protein [Lachnospiraceae bacterium]|nr:TrkA family potassium uptake protein [Lachnospiraceae bacterium]
MFKKSKGDRMTYGIVGLGRFGYALTMELAQAKADLIVIDSSEEKIRELREVTENAFVVKSLDKKTLMETGIQNCDVAVVCIGERMDTSILTTLNLVSLHIPLVIAKATSADHGSILEKLGAEVVYPERDMAVRLANRLETTRALDFIQLSEKINVSKLQIPQNHVGNTVLELNLRSQFGLNIIAIENDGMVMEVINPEYQFRKNDILFLAGSKEGLLKFSQWVSK